MKANDSDIPSEQIRKRIAEAIRGEVFGHGLKPLDAYLAAFSEHAVIVREEYAAAVSVLEQCLLASEGAGARAGLADPDEGRTLGPWKLGRLLGRGGQGAVYLAEDARFKRRAAVKVLTATGLTDHAIQRFEREAAITSRLDHPGICTVYDVGLSGRTPYIAMRYVEGESLAQRIATAKSKEGADSIWQVELPDTAEAARTQGEARPAAPPAKSPGARPADPNAPSTQPEIFKIVRLVEQAARALHAAHEAGVIHRDIKPGNLMVGADGEPVVLDFGLAHEVDSSLPGVTVTGDLMGTPAYMSPEQITAHCTTLDRRTDIYSLGVTLFECLALRRPFDAPTREGLYQAILTKDPPDVRRLNPAIPTDLRVVLETALEKDRDHRYATALEFAEELRRVREHEPIRAKPAGPLIRLLRWTQRHPSLAAALIGLFAVLAAGLSASLFYLGQATTERNAKAAALDDYDRLGDVSRLSRLVAEAKSFWPASPSKVDAMRTWLEEARRLEENLPGHRAVREALRTSAEVLPYTDADRAADGERLRPIAERQKAAATERVGLAALLTAAESRAASRAAPGETASRSAESAPPTRAESLPTPDALRAALTKLDSELETLNARLRERLTWRFATESAQFKHDTIGKLTTDLAMFLDADPFADTVASVKKRLAFAESVDQETLKKHADRWALARASVADRQQCPKYEGLQLAPQLGLVPIRKDPQSWLWEFAHLQTTADDVDPIPTVRPDGRYDLKETTGLIFVLIPGGTFQMGARRPTAEERKDAAEGEALPPNVDPLADLHERPVHAVTLAAYFLSKYEMTQGQWLRLVGRNPSSYKPGPKFSGKTTTLLHPVEQISWEDCAGEHGWINRLGLELPTEAQWEYANRAGTTTPWWTGKEKESIATGGNLADDFCRKNGGPPGWTYEAWSDGYTVHAPVGRFAANGFGLHDTIGNVWEWCRDGYTGYAPDNWRKEDGLRDAGPSPSTRVNRGGSFSSVASSKRSSLRLRSSPEDRDHFFGVRPSVGVIAP